MNAPARVVRDCGDSIADYAAMPTPELIAELNAAVAASQRARQSPVAAVVTEVDETEWRAGGAR